MLIRAFHLDLKTGCFHREYLKSVFRRLAALGYTHLVIELEDRVRLESITGAWWHESYSKGEFSQILRDASGEGLTPVPLIQTLGHLEFLLSRSRYHFLRETPASDLMLCPSMDESRNFLKKMIAEVHELFGSPPFMHLGADEAYHLGSCPSCRGAADARGKGELFSRHINELAAEVLAKKTRPLAWADMALTYPGSISALNRDLTLVDWDYNTGDGIPEAVRIWGEGMFSKEQKGRFPAAFISEFGEHVLAPDGSFRPWPYTGYLMEKGFRVWVAPAATSSGDHYFIPRSRHFPNVAGSVNRLAAEPNPEGMMVTSWATRLTVLETQWPAIAVPAAGPGSWEDLKPAVSSLVFGESIDDIFPAWEKISAPLVNTHSYLGQEHGIYYYGPAEPLSRIMPDWDKKGRLEPEFRFLEDKKQGYREGERITAGLMKRLKPGRSTISYLNFASRAMQAKAKELELGLKSYYDGESNPAGAAELLVRTEELKDEYAGMLSEIYMPASVERFLAIIFDGSRRHLVREAGRRG